MYEREAAIYRFMSGYAKRLLESVADADYARQPFPSMNHPAWLAGHLAVVNDFALRLLDRPPHCDPAWHPLFAPGSAVSPDRAIYPAKDTLVAEFLASTDKVLEALPSATAEQAARPNPVAFLRPAITDCGQLMAHLLTAHLAVHVGQLSAWRRAAGMPAA